MYILRRWWDRYGLQIGVTGLAIGAAWLIRQTQGALLYETYQWLSRPFQADPTKQERLADSQVLELQERLIELEAQNQRLQELVGYMSRTNKKGIGAPVIGRSADHWWQQLTLGRGSKDGIKPGFVAATSNGGVVGRVVAVTPNTSRLLLITDPTSQVGVAISRSRYTGFLRGQGENRAVMEFFDKVPDVRRGDVVSTSSFSQFFPAGLPVGRIESVDLNKSPAPEAVIQLSAPISYLEWVVLYPNPKADTANLLPDSSAIEPQR